MKKIYQIPTTIVVHVETQLMVSESMFFGNTVDSAAGAESRYDDSDWDDDEY